MVALADYLAGRRVFRGSSFAPQFGAMLDPTGYVNRGIQNPTQNRSGLAAAALRRTGGVTSPTATRTFSASGTTAAKPPTPASSTGKIDFSVLPIDPEILQLRTALDRNKTIATGDFARVKHNVNEDYGLQTREVKEQHPYDVQQLLGAFGARGMGVSGGQAVARTRQEKDYQTRLADLARTRGRGLADLSSMQAQYNTDYQNQLERLLIQQAQRASEKSGSLNLMDILKKAGIKL